MVEPATDRTAGSLLPIRIDIAARGIEINANKVLVVFLVQNPLVLDTQTRNRIPVEFMHEVGVAQSPAHTRGHFPIIVVCVMCGP